MNNCAATMSRFGRFFLFFSVLCYSIFCFKFIVEFVVILIIFHRGYRMVIFGQNIVLSKFLSMAVVVLGLISCVTYCDNKILGKKCSYREIGDMYMRSFGLEKESEQVSQIGEEGKDGKIKPLQLSAKERRSLTFNLLARREECFTQSIKSDELLRMALEDLEVFYAPGRNYDSTLFAHLNHTRTVFGEVVLCKLLANPEVDSDVLRSRQVFIQELINNEDLFQELEVLVAQVCSAEENILSFWKEENQVTKKVIDKLYFGKKLLERFNTSSIALETKVRLRNLLTGLGVGSEFWTFVGMSYLSPKIATFTLKLLENSPKIEIPEASLWGATKESCKAIWTFYSPKKWFDRFFHPYRELAGNSLAAIETEHSGGILDHDYLESIREGTLRQKKWSTVFWAAAFAGLSVYTVFQYYNKKRLISFELQANDLQLYLQRRLIDMARLVSSVKQMYDLASQNQNMSKALSTSDTSSKLFDVNSSISSDAKTLIELFQTRTFKGNASVFSLTGRVLSAYQLMSLAKDELICAMEAIGELDAYLSIAKLYKKHVVLPVRYCFAQYIETDKPYVDVRGFWNPVLESKKAVINDLILGGDGIVRNGIVTGSNTGGKSTLLKALSINTLLAQTFGIVSAESCAITPFVVITTSLNVKDDTAAGQSLFKAEVIRAQKLIEAIKHLPTSYFAFYVIDELFMAASPEKGQEAAYQVATKLCDSSQLLYLWATHYPRLTQLEKDTKGVCKNYKMEAYKDEETGKLICPFKLEEGISTSNIATDILESELGFGSSAFLA